MWSFSDSFNKTHLSFRGDPLYIHFFGKDGVGWEWFYNKSLSYSALYSHTMANICLSYPSYWAYFMVCLNPSIFVGF